VTGYGLDDWGVGVRVPRSRKCGFIHPLPPYTSWRSA
jgi:hypothetical protein